jgi:hypothetical protein
VKTIRAKTLILCALLAAGVGTILILNNEPRAAGQPLSHWLQLGSEQDANDIFSESKHPNMEADAAVRKIGVRAVPVLLQKLRATDPKWRRSGVEWVCQHLGLAFEPSKAEHEWAEAHYGFRILGTQAVVAIPDLAQMLFQTNTDCGPTFVLAQLGRDATPVIRAALTNANLEICRGGIMATGWSQDIGREVIPELTALTSSSDRMAANFSAMQLRRLLPLEEFVRVTSRASGPNQYSVHRVMLRTLAESKTNVAFAVPVVVSMLASPDGIVGKLATNTLIQIDPIAAAAQGIDTNAPPAEIRGRTGQRQPRGAEAK